MAAASPKAGWLCPPATPRARTFAWASLGTGAAALALGLGFGAGAWSELPVRSTAVDETTFDAADAAMRSRATIANTAFGVGTVALVGAALFWLKGDSILGGTAAAPTATR